MKKFKLLYNTLNRFHQAKFSSDVEKFLSNLEGFKEKIKQKQTLVDKKNLQRFLESQLSNGKLQSTIDRTSKIDLEFNSFLQSYKQKHREYPNIVDVSSYTQDQGLFSKSPEMRKEEILWMDEFRKRQQSKAFKRCSDKILDDQDDQDTFASGDQREADKSRAPTFGEKLFEKDEFVVLIISRGTTTLVTKLNRVNHFRYLIFMGNGNGVIGYGKGSGNNFEEALDKSLADCKKNLIAVNLDHFLTLPRKLEESYYGLKMIIEPRKSFNSWGQPNLCHMLLLTGITHCRFHLIYRNLNPYALVLCYFKCVTQNYTPQQISEIFGTKIYRRNWGRPLYLQNYPLNPV